MHIFVQMSISIFGHHAGRLTYHGACCRIHDGFDWDGEQLLLIVGDDSTAADRAVRGISFASIARYSPRILISFRGSSREARTLIALRTNECDA